MKNRNLGQTLGDTNISVNIETERDQWPAHSVTPRAAPNPMALPQTVAQMITLHITHISMDLSSDMLSLSSQSVNTCEQKL